MHPTPTTCDPSRGAALNEYAMVLALVVIGMVGAIDALTNTSGQLLEDVGNNIGTPRDYQNVVIETQVAPPPPWVSTDPPSTILTWVDRPIATTEGCVGVTGATIGVVACGAPEASSFNGLSEDGLILELGLVDGSACLAGDTSGPSPVVSVAPCGGAGQDWREVSNSGTTATYQHEPSGLCLQTVVPAAPNPLTLAACDGSPNQTIEVMF